MLRDVPPLPGRPSVVWFPRDGSSSLAPPPHFILAGSFVLCLSSPRKACSGLG